MNQGLCWDAGDKLDWGKAQGRVETSALWTPSSWKTSPHHDLLKEQLVLHATPLTICLQRHWSRDWQISHPWACSSALPGPRSPKHPPLRPTWSPPDLAHKACQASDPETLMISASTRSVCLRPAQAFMISAVLGCTPKACQAVIHSHCMISAQPGHAPQACTGLPELCQAVPISLAKLAINTHTHNLYSAGPCPSGTPSSLCKGPLDCLNDWPSPEGLWDPSHLPPSTGGLQI
jgi:hypothetical protein